MASSPKKKAAKKVSGRKDVWEFFTPEDKDLLKIIARDVALLVTDPVDRKHFQDQLRLYIEKEKDYKNAIEADRQGKWKPEMRTPPNPHTALRPSINRPSDWPDIRDSISESEHGPAGRKHGRGHGIHLPYTTKETRKLACYLELGILHDTVRPEPESLCSGIIPKELFDDVLSLYLERLPANPYPSCSYNILHHFVIKFKKLLDCVQDEFRETRKTTPAKGKQGLPAGIEEGCDDIGENWITVSEAKRIANVNSSGTISQWVKGCKIKSNGEKRKKRKIDKPSLLMYLHERKEKERQRGYNDYSQELDGIPEKH